MSSLPAVEVEHVGYRYGDRRALDDVSFTVGSGELFGLLGPNGGGKSTLFKLLSTLQPLQEGRVCVLGQDLTSSADEVRRRIGVVFQSFGLDKKLSVRENLVHQGHLYGLRGAGLAARIRALLDRFGLGDRADDRVESLSGGLARRVEIAKGLLHGPELLLLDEPSVGLDPGARRDLTDHLNRLRREDRVTVLLTTHFLEEAEGCSRIAILDRGRLSGIDTPDGLKREIAGEVLLIATPHLARVEEWVRRTWQVAVRVADGLLRVELPEAATRLGELAGAFPRELTSIQIHRATLEDVFLLKTGHRFQDEGAA